MKVISILLITTGVLYLVPAIYILADALFTKTEYENIEVIAALIVMVFGSIFIHLGIKNRKVGL